MGQISVFSPAKINLFLAVLGRLPSGFHELASLVAHVDFGDHLEIEIREAGRARVDLSCSDPALPVDGRNLAFAAAAEFLRRSGLRWDVEIRLEKRIPYGAGLGGGSSNAAAVLSGLSELAEAAGQRGLGPDERLELAAELGSDCPLFLGKRPTIMRGRGERLNAAAEAAARGLAGRELLLFKPSFPIATVWAYRQLAKTPTRYDEREWAEARLQAWESGEASLDSLLYNRFEAAVFEKYQAYEPLFKRLRERGLAPLMSGSGSACFVLLDASSSVEEAESIVRDCWGRRAFVERSRILA